MVFVHVLSAFVAAAGVSGTAIENARTGTSTWLRPSAPAGSIEGYLSAVSAAPGEAVSVHVSAADGVRYRVEIFRLGWYDGTGARLVRCLPDCSGDYAGAQLAVPPRDPSTQEVTAGWPTAATFTVAPGWTSGYYLVELVATTGTRAGSSYTIPLVIRAAHAASASRILVVAPTNTWQAYNNWGGASTYAFNSVAQATKVSFDRPGITDRSGLQYEIPLVRFLERNGYDVTYETDSDLDAHPAELLRHRLVIVAGHSEYWTSTMRTAYASAIDLGTNVAFMGANYGYWQARYEDNRRTLVAYKESAWRDPVGDPQLATTRFRALPTPLRECELGGVQWLAGAWNLPPSPLTVVASPADDPWLRGTGFRAGDSLPGLVGGRAESTSGEWDSLIRGCVQGDPKVLFHFDSGASGKPAADVVRYKAASGAIVFSAGTHRFSWGLDNDTYTTQVADPRLQLFMEHAMADLQRPAPPSVIDLQQSGNSVSTRVDAPIDPRVGHVAIFVAGETGPWRLLCRGVGATCTAPALQPGRYRIAAVVGDRWGRSRPLIETVTLARD